MTYDPRQSFKAQQAAYSRAAGTQTSKQQGISQGRGTPDYSSSAYDSGGYDEIKLPSAGKVDQKIKTGLGSPSSGTDKKDDRNLDQKIYDGMKYYGAKFLGLDKPDPRADDMFLLEVYGGDDMFVIPEPTPMTINYLDDDGDYLGSYDFIDMSKLGNDPRQPRTQPNIDTAPQIGGYDEAPVLTQPKGLMSPPDPEVPDVNIDDDEMARIAGQTTAPKSEPNTYTVTAGDTLSEIAAKTGTTVDDLQELNAIEDIDVIKTGEQLKIPSARSTKTKEDIVSSIVGDYVKKTGDAEGVEVAALGSGIMGTGLMSKLFGEPDIEGNVDFSFIGQQEGVGIKKGYIPKKDGKVLDKSGVTVGTGVDLGSKNDAYFKGLSEEIKAKLRPHYGKKKDAAVASLKSNPLTLTSAQVAELDTFVKNKEINNLKSKWNRDSDTDFDSLPKNKATAVASVYFQYGNKMVRDHKFWKQVTSGDWEAALDNLRDYKDKYPSRRNREADYLESGEL